MHETVSRYRLTCSHSALHTGLQQLFVLSRPTRY